MQLLLIADVSNCNCKYMLRNIFIQICDKAESRLFQTSTLCVVPQGVVPLILLLEKSEINIISYTLTPSFYPDVSRTIWNESRNYRSAHATRSLEPINGRSDL